MIHIIQRIKEICEEFDCRVKVVGIAIARLEIAKALAGAEEEISNLKQLGIKAGEEIKHLRACIVDRTDKHIEIDMLKEKLHSAMQTITDLEEDARRFPTMAEFSNLQDDCERLKQKLAEAEKRLKPIRQIYKAFAEDAKNPMHSLNDEYTRQWRLWQAIKQAAEDK
jgi:ElaB/YqjD/DUF883 family membrane-anchored ribosome-binding protein